jgi:hypothetical protein
MAAASNKPLAERCVWHFHRGATGGNGRFPIFHKIPKMIGLQPLHLFAAAKSRRGPSDASVFIAHQRLAASTNNKAHLFFLRQ